MPYPNSPYLSRQPNWVLIAQLGDIHPIDHGGIFVYRDTTGVYDPEVEVLEIVGMGEDEDNEGNPTNTKNRIAYRFGLKPCTFENGILSDNRFHPDHPAWFADSIENIADGIGVTAEQFIEWLCRGSVEEKALAWCEIGQYSGWENLDSYPVQLTRAEAVNRYAT